MPTESQMQDYIDGLGITRMTISTRDYDDEFTTMLYQILTDGRNNLLFTRNGDLLCDRSTGNPVYI